MLAQKNNGRILLKLGVVLLILAAAGFFASRSLQSTARVKVVGRDTAVDAITGSVTVAADGGYKEVKSEVPGKVLAADAINKGELFTKGATLVQLDTTEVDRQIAEAKRLFESGQERAKLELQSKKVDEKVAEETLATAIRLRDLGNVPDDQVKAAQRALDALRSGLALVEFDRKKIEADYNANMETLRLLKEKMTIPAPPIDGEVLMPLTWQGALINAGQSVATVFSNRRIVSAKISEESFGKVRLGQEAKLRLLSYGSRSFTAKVSRLLPTADDAQRFEVYLDVEADPKLLLPGSTGEVTITIAKRPNAIVIPRRARFDLDKVYVVKNGRVQVRKIEVGYDSAMNVIEVLKGLEVGEQVIVDNLDEFRDGQRVQVEVVK